MRHIIPIICIALTIGLYWSFFVKNSITDENKYDYRATVQGIQKLHEKANINFPPNFAVNDLYPMRTGQEFDPNSYFDVLNHLSVRDNYKLDYLYVNIVNDGYPLLYVRKEVSQPFRTYEDLRNAVRNNVASLQVLNHLKVDGTPESFFELICFKELADQFYCHSLYSDTKIVTDKKDIEDIILMLSKPLKLFLPLSEEQATMARTINPKQKIEFKDEASVEVTYVIFSKWKGFVQRKVILSKIFPHKEISSSDEELVYYNCGLRF